MPELGKAKIAIGDHIIFDGRGGGSGISVNPTPVRVFRNEDITPAGWVASDGTELGKYGGTYQTDGKCLVCNGSKQAVDLSNSSYRLWGIRCSVNSDFTPYNDTRWWMASCIMGQELSGQQRDYGCVISNDGYFALGWGLQNITKSSVYALDGKVHDIFIFATQTRVVLVIDGKVEACETLVMSGSQINRMGIFWNASNNNSVVKGRVYSIGCWDYDIDDTQYANFPILE